MRGALFVGQAVSPACFLMPEYRKKLPLLHPAGKCLFITRRLKGSMPGKPGPVWLNDARVADLVAESILIGRARGSSMGYMLGL
jgi:hypothetical protein